MLTVVSRSSFRNTQNSKLKKKYLLFKYLFQTFPATSRIEEFSIDENGKFKPTKVPLFRKQKLIFGIKTVGKSAWLHNLSFEALTNVRIEKNRDDNSIVTLEHSGTRVKLLTNLL